MGFYKSSRLNQLFILLFSNVVEKFIIPKFGSVSRYIISLNVSGILSEWKLDELLYNIFLISVFTEF